MDRVFDWNPRIGDIGDENWDLPHGTKMDGTVVADKSQALLGFGSQSYPSVPALANVDAGSGFNQIIAAMNYKSNLMDVSGFPFSIASYLGTKNIKRVAPLIWSSIPTNINQLRLFEGFDDFDFTDVFAGDLPRAWVIAERRKALALIGVSRYIYGAYEAYFNPGNPLLLGLSGSSIGGNVNPSSGIFLNIGQFASGFTDPTRLEAARHFRNLPWMHNWLSASIEVVVSNASGAFTGELWLSNTSDKFYGGSGSYAYDNLIGTFSANGTYTFDLSAYASIITSPQIYLSFVLTTSQLRAGSLTPGGYQANITLVRDYGA